MKIFNVKWPDAQGEFILDAPLADTDISDVINVKDGIQEIYFQITGAGEAQLEWSLNGVDFETMKDAGGADSTVTVGTGKAYLAAPFLRVTAVTALGMTSALIGRNINKGVA